ncbi:potassium-transporting ATPase subunit C [Erwinia sp. OLTSP20]|uniref:potassium-transporting ATPase subunit KdpC n=1 Tax=unclassified Erwinia TaxID=2622719 RepID=UPI000C191422|nr:MULTISPECIES: potassium-transporting ATPase subunit KdpC [unclassified Erwinia]PIJ50444.1 potassium-transporting ATPase subunit C [Erwinia sp. OAMSP11]PIJ72515.1 potassium-transporting ATPase subunit C [Erwinia sp. OLSSP12]PIJ81753.1 potassium-transporting ATPase subunit C [Erwinia sp. OLCASP19]PIJ84346.1 potassium-transporting ATPase subunit C [Erwinia sp. OLMTSP26]PIJ86210.1 potassium-transporting ATPase subunit C [Erwinia sp. OLMDSP33]
MYQLRPALLLLMLFTLLTGIGYPLLTTLLGQWWFPFEANGSLLSENNRVQGSALIGQRFTRPEYFQGRPSATADFPYNPLASSGSNLGPTNPALYAAIKQRVADLKVANPQQHGPVPLGLVTASASGLDPHISPQDAYWQAPRVAAARHLSLSEVEQLIADNTYRPVPGFIGPPGVNVLLLNNALDKLTR